MNKFPQKIVNMVNIVTESVNVVELETQAVKQVESKRAEGCNAKISKVIEFMTDSEKHVKV